MDKIQENPNNPIIENLLERRTIRKYKNIPLDSEIIGELIYAARNAPSAGNLQARKFIVVTDPSKKKALADAAFHQYWIATAPVVIVVIAEPEKLQRFYGVRGERLYSVQECAVAAENIITAAGALGLGSAFVSAFDEEEVRALLKIPAFARPQIIITVGYPDEEALEPPKYELWDLIYLQSYGAKIRDVEGYMGYGHGRNIKKYVMAVGNAINSAGKAVEKHGPGIIEKIKEFFRNIFNK